MMQGVVLWVKTALFSISVEMFFDRGYAFRGMWA
jgi:hypothetical protein